jgi:hypothetical protein
MAMKTMIKIKADPAGPIKCVATAGGTSPLFASVAVIGNINAAAANPRDVAKENGMANQQILTGV